MNITGDPRIWASHWQYSMEIRPHLETYQIRRLRERAYLVFLKAIQPALKRAMARVREKRGETMNGEDVGLLFTKNGEDAWKMVWYDEKPTACMENLETKERKIFSVGSPMAQEFKRLRVNDG